MTRFPGMKYEDARVGQVCVVVDPKSPHVGKWVKIDHISHLSREHTIQAIELPMLYFRPDQLLPRKDG